MKFEKLYEEIINENNENVFFVKQGNTYTLWWEYSEGSGRTTVFKDFPSFITNKVGDNHFDSISDVIKNWSLKQKPLKESNTYKLFKIKIVDFNSKKEKPLYMTITKDKLVVINFFENKNEALNWIK